MNNSIGFENERWYKVVSVGDNTVVQIDETNRLICTTEDETKKECQRFQAISADGENFRLASKFQKVQDSVEVWDYFRHRSLLIQKKKTAAEVSTQTWRALGVPTFDCIFFIISAPNSNKCLKNMNTLEEKGQQIKVVDKPDAPDTFTYWRLEPEPLA